jgi:glutathione S-transferase
MAGFIVHSIPGSPFGRSVLAVLEHKAADYRLAAVAPGGLKQQPHLGRHPFGRVPVLEQDGFMLYEVQAILRYLDRIIPTPALTPTDPQAAARMDQAMNINDWYLFQGCANVIGFQRVVGPRLLGLIPDETVIETAMPRAHQVFNELGRLLDDRLYFGGTVPSLADFMLGPQIDFLAATPEWEALTVANRNIAEWTERLEALPAMGATTWEKVARMADEAGDPR